LERAVPRLERRSPSGGDHAPVLLPPVRIARRPARAPPVEPTVARGRVWAARAHGRRVRVRRAVPVGEPRRLLEPEGDRRQRVRTEWVLLPRELGLLQPLHLRAFSRARDPGLARDRAVHAPVATRRLSRRRDRRDLDRALLLLLAVELRDAGRRGARGGR